MPKKSHQAARTMPQRRPPEIDNFVDQFLSTTCETSRRYILEMLVPPEDWDPQQSYELRSGEIAKQLGLAKGTTSDHLRQLAELHLVVSRRDGTEIYYRLPSHELVLAFQDMLQALDKHYRKHITDQEP